MPHGNMKVRADGFYLYIKADNDLISKVTKIIVSPKLDRLSKKNTQLTRHD